MPICSSKDCNNERRLKQRYCNVCHAAWMRKNRKRYADLTPFEAMKEKARYTARNARRDGKLIQESCKCGCKKVEMHHPDYTKPLEIVWICRHCHLELHENERKEAEFINVG